MNVWTVVTDSNWAGTQTQVAATVEQADALAYAWCVSHWFDEGSLCPSDWVEAYEIISQGDGNYMWVECHELTPPVHAAGSIERLLIENLSDLSGGDLEVDDNPTVSISEDEGAYIQCWKWVPWNHVNEDMALTTPNGTVWYFDLFEEFMLAWQEAPKGSTYCLGTPELLEKSEGVNDSQEFILHLENCS